MSRSGEKRVSRPPTEMHTESSVQIPEEDISIKGLNHLLLRQHVFMAGVQARQKSPERIFSGGTEREGGVTMISGSRASLSPEEHYLSQTPCSLRHSEILVEDPVKPPTNAVQESSKPNLRVSPSPQKK